MRRELAVVWTEEHRMGTHSFGVRLAEGQDAFEEGLLQTRVDKRAHVPCQEGSSHCGLLLGGAQRSDHGLAVSEGRVLLQDRSVNNPPHNSAVDEPFEQSPVGYILSDVPWLSDEQTKVNFVPTTKRGERGDPKT